MVERPYTLLSCGMSIDGYVDDAGAGRLLLSNDADFDRVDAVRAGCDAILVGAATVRQDNPRLLVRSPARRRERVARGEPPTPLKVTVTGSCDLDPGAIPGGSTTPFRSGLSPDSHGADQFRQACKGVALSRHGSAVIGPILDANDNFAEEYALAA